MWGAVHAMGRGGSRQMPGFEAAFEAYGGRLTFEVCLALRSRACLLPSQHVALAMQVLFSSR